jgi:hypothetical protein
VPGPQSEAFTTESYQTNADALSLHVAALRVVELRASELPGAGPQQGIHPNRRFRVDGLRPALASELPGYIGQFVGMMMPVASQDDHGAYVPMTGSVRVLAHHARIEPVTTKRTKADDRFISYFNWVPKPTLPSPLETLEFTPLASLFSEVTEVETKPVSRKGLRLGIGATALGLAAIGVGIGFAYDGGNRSDASSHTVAISQEASQASKMHELGAGITVLIIGAGLFFYGGKTLVDSYEQTVQDRKSKPE